jgi:hypothetical protein
MFLANPTDHPEFAELIELFDFTKLADRDVGGIVGFFNTRWQKLLLEHGEGIATEAAELHLIKRMCRR